MEAIGTVISYRAAKGPSAPSRLATTLRQHRARAEVSHGPILAPWNRRHGQELSPSRGLFDLKVVPQWSALTTNRPGCVLGGDSCALLLAVSDWPRRSRSDVQAQGTWAAISLSSASDATMCAQVSVGTLSAAVPNLNPRLNFAWVALPDHRNTCATQGLEDTDILDCLGTCLMWS